MRPTLSHSDSGNSDLHLSTRSSNCFSGLTICAPGKLGLTEEIDRLELVSDFGNLTLGYFTAMGRQAAFRKLAGAEVL
jgi:hypothetical protein